MIPTRQREGGVPGGERWQQCRDCKEKVRNCRALVGGEWEHSVDPGCVEERNQVS